VLLTSSAAAQSIDGFPESRFVIQAGRLPRDGGAIEVRYLTARELSAQAPRLSTAATAAVTLLQDWFGPFPAESLTVAGTPWRGSDHGTALPGLVTAPLRWIAPVRDQSMERAIIGALVRQYFAPDVAASQPFVDSLITYAATRAVHHLLEGSNFAAPRFFGGFVPFPLRTVLLSPPVGDPRPRVAGFAELAVRTDGRDLRGVRALESLERYVGWPTMLAALSQLRMRDASEWTALALADALSTLRGTDMRFLVQECVRADAVFDYAIGDLRSQAVASGQVETTVTIVRRGTGRFAIRDNGGAAAGTLPVAVRFADGREIRDVVDGGAESATLVYTAPAPAVRAVVDPDVILLLDADRANNAVVRDAKMSKLGIRLAMHWLAWLQNTMLSYAALS